MHPLFKVANLNARKVAIISQKAYTYQNLLSSALKTAKTIKGVKPNVVAMLSPNSLEYVVGLYATWSRGSSILPLSLLNSVKELEYFLNDSKSDHVLLHRSELSKYSPFLKKLNISYSVIELSSENNDENINLSVLPSFESSEDALIVYTSGTTGKPKGVIHTHGSIMHQIKMLEDAWKYSSTDHLLHVLPLNHIHGIVNALLCPLHATTSVEFLQTGSSTRTFDANKVWTRILKGSEGTQIPSVTMFMGVPTMYSSMLRQLEMLDNKQAIIKAAQKSLRLCISGSNALPETVFEEWTSNVWDGKANDPRARILERYGMTETGMLLTNPLCGSRVAGTVGNPFPGVKVKLSFEGEMLVQTPGLFKEYLGKPESTKDAFSEDGWFKTGDYAVKVNVNNGQYFRILGRKSTDILKVSGYKISALDIEREILTHYKVKECAVIGVEDENQSKGQRIVAVVSTDDMRLTSNELKQFLAERLSYYKIPKEILFVEKLPRNSMGKVNKKTLLKDIC